MKGAMKKRLRIGVAALAMGWTGGAAMAAAFNSGSTGADGTFAPTQNTALVVPPSGIFNFTNVSIPSGVTVTFQKNASNSPVVILATGNVAIAGAIDVSGASAQPMRTGGGALPDGGVGGPGGFDGGRGGDPGGIHGAAGQGPGAGRGGNYSNGNCAGHPQGGGGAGYSNSGEASYCWRYGNYYTAVHGQAGGIYGSNTMLPLLGGSGGGGGAGGPSGTNSPGGGGGGGGGALLIAATGNVQLTGTIRARGGNGAGWFTTCGDTTAATIGGGGGGGSGGAVRVLASAYIGGGTIDVGNGLGGCRDTGYWGGGHGALGRVSIETMRGGTLNFTGLPSLNITQVAGVAVPANPTGAGDVSLPLTQANPVTVNIAASNVPLGAAVKLTLTPFYSGDAITADSTPLAGSFESSTATASINIPNGPSVLIAQVSYTLTLAMGNTLSTYAQGERVERVLLTASPGKATQVKLVTISGREVEVAPAVLAFMQAS